MGYLSIKPNYPFRYTGKKASVSVNSPVQSSTVAFQTVQLQIPSHHTHPHFASPFTTLCAAAPKTGRGSHVHRPSQSRLQEQLLSGPLAAVADVPALGDRDGAAFAQYGDGGSREPQHDKPKHPKPSYLYAASGLWDSEMQRQTRRVLWLSSQGQAPPLPKLFLPSMLS